MREGDTDLVTGSRNTHGALCTLRDILGRRRYGPTLAELVGGCSEGARKDILVATAVLGSTVSGLPSLCYWSIALLAHGYRHNGNRAGRERAITTTGSSGYF